MVVSFIGGRMRIHKKYLTLRTVVTSNHKIKETETKYIPIPNMYIQRVMSLDMPRYNTRQKSEKLIFQSARWQLILNFIQDIDRRTY